MKTILTITLSLLASLPAFADNNEVTITCGGGGAGIRVAGNRNMGIHGGLTDNYNHANIACKDFTYDNLTKAGDTLPCTGFWNIAFDEKSNGVDVAVVAKITRQADGSLVATYERNWDARGKQSPRKIRIACSAQES